MNSTRPAAPPAPAAEAAEGTTDVWLTYYAPSASRHKGIYASLELAKRSCEVNVEEWIASPTQDDDGEPDAQLHPVEWTREPDPGLPEAFHSRVPEDKYVWIGRYCADEPTWYFKVVRETVIATATSPV